VETILPKKGNGKETKKLLFWNESNDLTSDKEFTAVLDACLAKLPP
jgi:hypothetical protein